MASSAAAAALNAAGITQQDVVKATKAVQDAKATKDMNDIQVVV